MCLTLPIRRACAHSCAPPTIAWQRYATTSARITQKYPDYRFYPCMPYAHKYANAVTEHGMVGALRMFLPQDGAISAMFRGGVALASKDIEVIVQLLVDAEMKMFHGLSTPVIFIQNVITDLLLGLGLKDALRIFADHVRNKYGAEPGFITMNMPKLLDVLEGLGIENPIVCANINKIGFRMCGGVDLYEKTIATRRFRPVAMSVLASGALSPREAIEYVCGQPQDRIDRVRGLESREHPPDQGADRRADGQVSAARGGGLNRGHQDALPRGGCAAELHEACADGACARPARRCIRLLHRAYGSALRP